MSWQKTDPVSSIGDVRGVIGSEGTTAPEALPAASMPFAFPSPETTTIDPQAWLARASEELTFQFSETVEAREHALEARMELHSGDHDDKALRIEQVQAIARLMEGREGFETLRAQTRAFANAFQKDPQQALAMLNLESMTPDRRYALIRMAQQTLESRGIGEGPLQALQEMQRTPATGASAVWRADTLANAVFENTDRVQSDLESYYSLIATQPSARTLLDSAVELGGQDGLLVALNRMQRTWGRSLPVGELEQLGGLLIVNRLVHVVRTMYHDAGRLLAQFGMLEAQQSVALNRHVRSLLDLTQSSLPANLIDKLITAWTASPRACSRCRPRTVMRCTTCGHSRAQCLCPAQARTCTCSDTRLHLLSLLHLHARAWPPAVWASAETKKSLLEQLIKKQPTRSSLDLARSAR